LSVLSAPLIHFLLSSSIPELFFLPLSRRSSYDTLIDKRRATQLIYSTPKNSSKTTDTMIKPRVSPIITTTTGPSPPPPGPTAQPNDRAPSRRHHRPPHVRDARHGWAESPDEILPPARPFARGRVEEVKERGTVEVEEEKAAEEEEAVKVTVVDRFRFRVGRKTRRRSTRRVKVAPAKVGEVDRVEATAVGEMREGEVKIVEVGKQFEKVAVAWRFFCFDTSRKSKKKRSEGRTWSSIIDPADFQACALTMSHEQDQGPTPHLPNPSPSTSTQAYPPSSLGSTKASSMSAARDESMRRLEGRQPALWIDPVEASSWGVQAW
ncbi:hypothetical protein BC938DRAFT_471509, partial [Jimgerdemannia flammicorona]